MWEQLCFSWRTEQKREEEAPAPGLDASQDASPVPAARPFPRCWGWRCRAKGSRLLPSPPPPPVAPIKALSPCPSYFHIRLMTVICSLIQKQDYPECSALTD